MSRGRLPASLAVVFGLGIALGATACSSTRTDTPGVDKVTYTTNLGWLGREGNAFLSQTKGYFSANRLSVTIEPGQVGTYDTLAVESGHSQFAAVDFTTVATQAASGTGVRDLRIVAAIQQQTRAVFIVRANSAITSPGDMAGKHVIMAQGSTLDKLASAYATQAGFAPGSIHYTQVKAAELPVYFAAHSDVDAILQYAAGQPLANRALGCAPTGSCVRALPLSAELGDLYGGVLITRADYADTHQDVVKRFVGAYIKGIQAMHDDPAAAGTAAHTLDPVHGSEDVAQAEATIERPSLTPYGVITERRLQQAIASLESGRVIASGKVCPLQSNVSPGGEVPLADLRFQPAA